MTSRTDQVSAPALADQSLSTAGRSCATRESAAWTTERASDSPSDMSVPFQRRADVTKAAARHARPEMTVRNRAPTAITVPLRFSLSGSSVDDQVDRGAGRDADGTESSLGEDLGEPG